jgi:endonuclease/exonuclease/phosphatase family metal-dependent hydrolase
MKIRLIVALVATVVSLAGGAPAQAASPSVRLMTFNICGNVCRHGEVAGTADNIAYQVRRRASVALLQEVCYAQFLGIQSRLARYGYTGVFAAASEGGRCNDHDHAHGKGFGVAILARGKLTGRVVHRLPVPSAIRPEGRVLLGATVRLQGRSVFVATTHTAPSGPNLVAQLAALNRRLAPIAATRPVLFGGDLNSLPASPGLDSFYGEFREANDDRVNPLPTFQPVPRKIDYLFGSRSFLTPSGVDTAATGYSDHRMYLGTFQFTG